MRNAPDAADGLLKCALGQGHVVVDVAERISFSGAATKATERNGRVQQHLCQFPPEGDAVIGPGISTKMACMGDLADAEADLLELLGVTSFEIDGATWC